MRIKSLSRSISIMFIYDLIMLSSLTFSLCKYFNFQNKNGVFISVLVTIMGLITLYLKSSYKIREFNINLRNFYRYFETSVFANIPAGIFAAFYTDKIVLTKFLCLNIICIWLGLYLYRLIFHYYLFNFKKTKRVLIFGANERAKAAYEIIRNKKALKMEVVGIVKSAQADKHFLEISSKIFKFDISTHKISELNEKIGNEINFKCDDVEIFDDGINLCDIVNKTKADIVIFTHKSGLVTTLSKETDYCLMTDFYEMSERKYYIDNESIKDYEYDVWTKYHNSCSEFSLYEVFKRRLDIITALVILIATLPITLLIALGVKLTDGENPFYTQDRVGKGGKIFKAYKLRTMYANDFKPKDTKKVGYVENQNEDNRVIPWCKIVRKARFDEIPQMINILKGDMSLVGPRCEWSEVADIYSKEVKGYSLRMLVDTAWTGWAQINQGYCFASDNEAIKLQYDLYYIKHRNLFWDLAIFIKAVFLAIGGRHA